MNKTLILLKMNKNMFHFPMRIMEIDALLAVPWRRYGLEIGACKVLFHSGLGKQNFRFLLVYRTFCIRKIIQSEVNRECIGRILIACIALLNIYTGFACIWFFDQIESHTDEE